MAKTQKEKKQKKENKILLGILFLVISLVMFLNNSEFVWVLFGVLEIPLWILGVIAAVVGIVQLVNGIKEKKAAKAQQPEA